MTRRWLGMLSLDEMLWYITGTSELDTDPTNLAYIPLADDGATILSHRDQDNAGGNPGSRGGMVLGTVNDFTFVDSGQTHGKDFYALYFRSYFSSHGGQGDSIISGPCTHYGGHMTSAAGAVRVFWHIDPAEAEGKFHTGLEYYDGANWQNLGDSGIIDRPTDYDLWCLEVDEDAETPRARLRRYTSGAWTDDGNDGAVPWEEDAGIGGAGIAGTPSLGWEHLGNKVPTGMTQRFADLYWVEGDSLADVDELVRAVHARYPMSDNPEGFAGYDGWTPVGNFNCRHADYRWRTVDDVEDEDDEANDYISSDPVGTENQLFEIEDVDGTLEAVYVAMLTKTDASGDPLSDKYVATIDDAAPIEYTAVPGSSVPNQWTWLYYFFEKTPESVPQAWSNALFNGTGASGDYGFQVGPRSVDVASRVYGVVVGFLASGSPSRMTKHFCPAAEGFPHSQVVMTL
ncbi:hypothetical protein AMK68_00195 [candidate division KD3-62 bacterium DG_56]|uniref:Uncharacterized protein n=1 Tax=candidate division KD3-62 bacterium DG_56 TaxID=1704032 RepID=A0A0S7XR15_9BACT|nr:MAG: hypothetical protein AMK68_00195 [candidate division KD3-62 bacterium DG_56]